MNFGIDEALIKYLSDKAGFKPSEFAVKIPPFKGLEVVTQKSQADERLAL